MNMNNDSINIFENFFAGVLESLKPVNEAKVITRSSTSAETDTRTKKYAVPAFSEQELALKNELLNNTNNTVKDHSIIAFLLSDGFFNNLQQISFNALQGTTSIPGQKWSIRDLVGEYLYTEGPYRIKLDDPDKDQKAKDALTGFWQICYYTNSAKCNNKGKLLDKLIDWNKSTSDPIPPQTFGGVTVGDDSGKSKKKHLKTFTHFDILNKFGDYVFRLEHYKTAIEQLFAVLKTIKTEAERTSDAGGVTEDLQIKTFLNSDFGKRYSDNGHIDSNRLYNELKELEITPEELSRCAAFHISMISDDESFNPTGLFSTAAVYEAPDLTETNQYIKKCIDSGTDTIDKMLGLGGLVKTKYDDLNNKINSILNPSTAAGTKPMIDKGSNYDFLKMKTKQLETASIMVESKVNGINDFYSKLARLALFVKNEGLPNNLNEQIIQIANMNDKNIEKIRYSAICDAQSSIYDKIKNLRLLWKNAWVFAQMLAYDINKTIYNTSEFQAKTPRGKTINLTYPTKDIFQTIQDLQLKNAFLLLNQTIEDWPALMNFVRSYKIPALSYPESSRFIGALNKNFTENNKTTEYKLKAAKSVFDKFIDDVMSSKDNNISYETKVLQYGEYLNNYKLNSNVIIRFIPYDNNGSDNGISYKEPKMIVRFCKIEESKDPIQIEIIANSGISRIKTLLTTINNHFSKNRSVNGLSNINIKLNQQISAEDRKIPQDGDFYPLLKKLIRCVIEFARDTISGIYDSKFIKNRSADEADAMRRVAESLFGKDDSKINSFLDYCTSLFVIDKTQRLNADKIVLAISAYAPAIIYEFMAYDYSMFNSIANKKSENTAPETQKDIDMKFDTLRYHIMNSNFKRRIDMSNIRTLDGTNEAVTQMINNKEFPRVVNTLMRGTLGPSDEWVSANSAFQEIEPMIGLADSSPDNEYKSHINSIIKNVKEAFSSILNLSDSEKQVSSYLGAVSLLPEDFSCILNWEKDSTGMAQRYYKFMQIKADKNEDLPDRAFAGARGAEKKLKELYADVCNNKFGTANEQTDKLALKYVILFYYIVCLGEYCILELNYGKTFEDGYVEATKKGKSTKTHNNKATAGSQTTELERIPIDRTPISGEIDLKNSDPTLDDPFEEEPDRPDTGASSGSLP